MKQMEPDSSKPDLFGNLWLLFRNHAGERFVPASSSDECITVTASIGDRMRLTVINGDAERNYTVSVDGKKILSAEIYSPEKLSRQCSVMKHTVESDVKSVVLLPGTIAQLICE